MPIFMCARLTLTFLFSLLFPSLAASATTIIILFSITFGFFHVMLLFLDAGYILLYYRRAARSPARPESSRVRREISQSRLVTSLQWQQSHYSLYVAA